MARVHAISRCFALWKKTLFAVGLAQVISIMGFMFVVPFIPLYIRELGVVEDSHVRIWAGLLSAAVGLPMAFFSPIWGALADRFGRKMMVERATFGGAVLLTLMGFVANVHQLLILRILQGMVAGTVGASVALVASVTPARRTGFSLGLMQTAVFAGASVGPLLGGLAADHFGFRPPFWIAGALLFVAGLLVHFMATEGELKQVQNNARLKSALGEVFSARGFFVVVVMLFFFNFAGTMAAPLFPLFVEELMPVRTAVASTAGLLLAVTGVMSALSSGVMGRLSDYLGQKKILLVCGLFAGAFTLPQAFATSVGQLFWLRLLFGLAVGGVMPAINALVSTIVPRHDHGKAFGLTSSVSCLGLAVGPLTGGFIASAFGLRLPFVIMGIILVAVALGALFLKSVPYTGAEAQPQLDGPA